MKCFLFILTMLFVNYVFSKGRHVNIQTEIQYAHLVKEVVIEKYESRNYNNGFPCTNKIDKIFVRELNGDNVYEIKPLDDGVCLSCYRTIDSLKRGGKDYNGYWPDINDTVLVVVNDRNELSLFANKQKGIYSFWSPYSTSSIATSFDISLPFKSYKPAEKATTINRIYVSQKDFWSYYKSVKSNDAIILIRIKNGNQPIIPIVIYNDSLNVSFLKAQIKNPATLQKVMKSFLIKEDSVTMKTVDKILFGYNDQHNLFRKINFNPIESIEVVKFFRGRKILELKIQDPATSYYFLNTVIKNTASNKALNDILIDYLPKRFQTD